VCGKQPAAGQPLVGRRILVTRRLEQSKTLADGLRSLGAEVVVVPAIEVALPEDPGPLDRALADLGGLDWLIFTSANAVAAVADRIRVLGVGDEDLRSVRVASVGPSTSRAFVERFGGRPVDLEPAGDYQATGLAAALLAEPGGVAGLRFLLPTSDRAGDRLTVPLRRQGAQVTVVVAYRTLPAPGLASRLRGLAGEIDLVCLASPSAASALAAAWPGPVKGLKAAVIGDETGAAARAAGMHVEVVARPSTAAGLIAAISGLTPPP
jgi:uroporphyrinogen-III synthase